MNRNVHVFVQTLYWEISVAQLLPSTVAKYTVVNYLLYTGTSTCDIEHTHKQNFVMYSNVGAYLRYLQLLSLSIDFILYSSLLYDDELKSVVLLSTIAMAVYEDASVYFTWASWAYFYSWIRSAYMMYYMV